MDLVLLLMAIHYWSGRRQIAWRRPDQHPHVPCEIFEQWKRLELRSRDIIIWLGFGLAVLEISVISLAYLEFLTILPFFLAAAPMGLVAMVISALIGSKAARIKKKYAIDLSQAWWMEPKPIVSDSPRKSDVPEETLPDS